MSHNLENDDDSDGKSLRINNFFTGLNTIIGLLIVAGICWMGSEVIGLKTSVATFTIQIQQAGIETARLQKEIDRDESILDEHGKRIQNIELRDNIRRQP